MLLTIDVGNTQTHVGAFKGDELVEHWRFATHRDATADELAMVVHDLLALRGIHFSQIDGQALSSVVPPLVSEYDQMFRRYFDDEVLIVGPGTKTGMPIKVDNPHELGADRLVNALAAYEQFKANCVVVDFGTAITYDAVSSKGEYLGGVIAPGILISADALFRAAAKLPRVELVKPKAALGKNSVHSIQSGIIFGYVGLVDGLVERLEAELGFPCTVIATGGLAPVVASESRTIDSTDEFLTLDGLRILYERNHSPSA